MSLTGRDALPRLLAELSADDYREGEPVPVPLDELAWSLSKMSPDGLDRLATFLLDLTKRSPLRTPAWDATRTAIESLVADISRTLHE